MAQSTSKKKPAGAKVSKQPRIGSVPSSEGPQPEPEREHAVPTCTVGFCPICLAVTAMQPMRPEVLEHLLNAGREFLLAAKSVLDARSEAVSSDDHVTRLEKIDIG
jgi:hypothetical protein